MNLVPMMVPELQVLPSCLLALEDLRVRCLTWRSICLLEEFFICENDILSGMRAMWRGN